MARAPAKARTGRRAGNYPAGDAGCQLKASLRAGDMKFLCYAKSTRFCWTLRPSVARWQDNGSGKGQDSSRPRMSWR
jgi:hypothetical protein